MAKVTKNKTVKKVLPKAQLGTLVKTIGKFAKPIINATKSAMGYSKPAVKTITKSPKVVVRSVNRTVKPVAKKINSEVGKKVLIDRHHAKLVNASNKTDKKAFKIAAGTAAAVPIAGIVNASINKAKKQKVVTTIKPKKK